MPLDPGLALAGLRPGPRCAQLVSVKSYRDVLCEYRVHPEYKFHGPDGYPCRRNTRELLQSRQVELNGLVRLIGREDNNLDEVQARSYAQLNEIITKYHNPNNDHFHQHAMPLLDHLPGRELAHLIVSTGAPSTESAKATSDLKSDFGTRLQTWRRG